jgi:hypothetical protein
MQAEDVLEVFVRSPESKQASIVLTGLQRLRAFDFREGNIILDVVQEWRTTVEMQTLAWLYDAENHVEQADFLQKKRSEIEQGKLRLVQVNASYGCTLVALCHQIEFKGATTRE